jgi:enoyl-[acyl-carrier protein] reductase II
MVLGAAGVQVGTRFVASDEASVHQNFKNIILNTPEGGTQLSLKQLTPVRLIKNAFFEKVAAAENSAASIEDLKKLLGRGRAKQGMFEGDMQEGELEIGQVSTLIEKIQPAAEIVHEMWAEFEMALNDPLK